MYEIVVKVDGVWGGDGVWKIGEKFDSETKAWAAVKLLRAIGPEWASSEYDVREVKE